MSLQILKKALSSGARNWRNIAIKYDVSCCLHSSVSFSYSEEESSKILEALNSKTSDELARYCLSQSRAQKIGDWKTKNGPFQTIEEILRLGGFGVKVTEKFYQSLLDDKPVTKEKIAKPRFGQFTNPVVPAPVQKSCKSCVSLHIGVSSVTWTRLELNRTSPCILTHWQHHDILDKKMHINDLVRRCIYLDKIIPAADCYVMETPPIAHPGSPGNAEQVNINIQKSQLVAILSFALCKRAELIDRSENCSASLNLFFLRRFIVSRLFRTLVGKERISTEQAVMDLLRTHYNLDDAPDHTKNQVVSPHAGEVIVPLDLREIYKSSEGYRRDFLGQSLLIGLTFVRLCLLKCPKSLTVIVGDPKLL